MKSGKAAIALPLNATITSTSRAAGPSNSYSIWQYPPNSIPGCCLNRLTILPAEASTDTGGTVTIDQNGDISQPPAAGGTVKGMVYVNGAVAPYKILRCFNSALAGAAASTPPCGIDFTEDASGPGFWDFDFGFEVDNRFFSATIAQYVFQNATCIFASPLATNSVQVNTPTAAATLKAPGFTRLFTERSVEVCNEAWLTR